MRGKHYRKGAAVALAVALLISMNGSVLASQAETSSEEVVLTEEGTEPASEETISEEIPEEVPGEEIPEEETYDKPAEEVPEETKEAEEAPVSVQQASFGDFLYVNRDDYLDFGVVYNSDDSNTQFRWLQYDLSSKQWKLLSDWSSSNWVSWYADCGDYWIRCEMKTSDGQESDKTQAFHYVAGNTRVDQTYVGDTGEGDATYNLLMTSTRSDVTYAIKEYDVASQAWSLISYSPQAQWAATTGTHWIRFEVYTKDGRLGDEKTFSFSFYEPVRRALLVANDGGDRVQRFNNNLDAAFQMMANSSFHGKTFTRVDQLKNESKQTMINQIKTTFADTQEGDISYLFITCHGTEKTGYLVLTYQGKTQYVTPAELKAILDENIKGTVVLMITGCYSGNMIQTESMDNTEEEYFENELNAFIEVFGAVEDSGELAVPKYKVLCAAQKNESSYVSSANGYNYAAKNWLMGCGWDLLNKKTVELYADADGNNKVTLNELHTYAYPRILNEKNKSHSVVYPENDPMVIFGRY